MNRGTEKDRLWSIILAGGEGERLKPFVQRWLGFHRPKQYCTLIGTRSMFQHTLDRADQIAIRGQKVTVIGRTHQREACAQFSPEKDGKLIVQPVNRDTAAGIYLALTHVRVEAPATPEQKELLAKLSPQQIRLTELTCEEIQTVLTCASGNGAPIGGLKVTAESG
jgi:mannose-1-phosphate guanylyltransferase